MAAADPLHKVLAHIVEFASALVKCDSWFIYVLEDDELVLSASNDPQAEVVGKLKIPVGEGITGWVAEHREPVTVSHNASEDPRFKVFHELPEDKLRGLSLGAGIVTWPRGGSDQSAPSPASRL